MSIRRLTRRRFLQTSAATAAVLSGSPLWLRSMPLCGPTSAAVAASLACCAGLWQAAIARTAQVMRIRRIAAALA